MTEPMTEHIRVKAMLIAPNSDFTAHAVALLPATAENPEGYHRLVGGGVEPGETHREALLREVREELGAEVRDLQYLGCVESIFTINGATGHEVVFVHCGRLDPEPAPTGAHLVEADGAAYPVVWRSLNEAEETLPLYPAQVVPLLHRLPRPTLGRDAQKRITVDSYDADWSGYAASTATPSSHVERSARTFAERVEPGSDGGRVLEIGSAGGRDAVMLESLGLTVDRTDITPAFVEALRAAGHDARVVDPLVDDLGSDLDGVWANAVLLHLNRPEMAIVLRRLRDAVRPGGRMFCTLKVGDGDGWSRHGNVAGARHFTFWREPDLRAVLTAAGWTVDELDECPGSKLGETWWHVQAHAD